MVWVLAVILSLLFACGKKEDTKGTQPEQGQVVVSLYGVSPEEIDKTYSVKAYFEAVRDVMLKPEVSGRVVSINVEEGQFVKAGQVLLKIDSSDYENTLNQLQAQLLQVRSNYENQKAIVERRRELFERDLIAREDYENAKTQLKVYEEMMRSVQAQIQTAKLNLERTNLRAPFGGYIAQRLVNLGDYVNPSTSTFRLITLDPIRLVFQVPQELLAYVKEGSLVKAYVEGVGEVEGRVFFVSPTADQNRLITVKASLSNAQGLLKPGMYAQVELSVGKERAFKVPERAVVLVGAKKVVWKIENSVAKPVDVDVLRQGGGFVWIRADLQEGDRIALDNAQVLREGMRVEVR